VLFRKQAKLSVCTKYLFFHVITLPSKQQAGYCILVGICGIGLLFRFGFGLILKKNWYLVQNEFGLVRFEKMQFGLAIIVIY